jgi:hypothetical protein
MKNTTILWLLSLFFCITMHAQVDFFTETINVPNFGEDVDARLQIVLQPNATEITRPFIIAEGFDESHLTDPEDRFGLDIEDFDEFVVASNSGALENNLSVSSNVRTYDLIYVSWARGTDDLRDNSVVLEFVLDWVNNRKVGPEPNVLYGFSMGGLISRFTLARMEQEDPNFDPTDFTTSPHEVRLLVTHDSPHRGFITHMGLQRMTRYLDRTKHAFAKALPKNMYS